MTDRILTVPEVSAKTSVAEGTLRYWRSIGYGPNSFKLGRKRVGYYESAVDAWLKQQVEETSSSSGRNR